MQPRIHIALMIYVGSYLPLSVILFFQDIKYSELKKYFEQAYYNYTIPNANLFMNNPCSAFLVMLICFLCFISTLFILKRFKSKREIEVLESKHASSDLMNYVLPYVITFMSIDYSNLNNVIGFLIFMAWLFIITFKSGLIMMNPLLTVFGWKLYDLKYNFVASKKEQQGVALSNMPIEVGQKYMQSSVQGIIVVNDKERA